MKRLIVIDVAGIFHQSWHATVDMEFGEAFNRTIAKVNWLSTGYDYKVVAFDSPPYDRKKISEDYKGQREKPTEVFKEQYKRTKDKLIADGYATLSYPGAEADDVCATIVDKLRGKHEIRVASSDKDLVALCCDADHVTVMSIGTGQIFDETEVRSKFGVFPADMTEFLSLVGDKADNILGVPGVGPVMAAKIINSPDGLSGILAGLPTDCVTERIQELVRKHKDDISKAYRLASLVKDLPIDVDSIFKERLVAPLATKPARVFEEEDTSSSMPTEQTLEAEFTEVKEAKEVAKSEQPTPVPARAQEPIKAVQVAATGALAKASVGWNDELEPRSMANASMLATTVVSSKLFSQFANPDAALSIIVAGREMGLRAFESLRCFHIIEGKPTLSSHLIVARAKADPSCKYFRMISSTDEEATFETWHRDDPEPTRLTYTADQARKAGLCPVLGEDDSKKSSNWVRRRPEMLRKTCSAQLARIVYPAASIGLYCPEEMGAEESQ